MIGNRRTLMILLTALFFTSCFELSLLASDNYANFAELAAANVRGVDYNIITRSTTSDVAIIAIHGGGIEPGTTELASQIAVDKFNYYTFYGMKSSNNSFLHITSNNFDEPLARNMVSKSSKTLSIHGCAGTDKFTYVGGLDKVMAAKVKKSLKAAGFKVMDAPSNLDGSNTLNIANSNAAGAGVQIELSNGLRASFFKDLTTNGRLTKTDAFNKYVNAINSSFTV